MALLSAWLLAGVNPRRPWDAAAFAASPALAAHRPHQLGHARGGAGRGRAVDLGARPAGGDRRADRARHGHQALPALPARPDRDHLPARAALPRPGRHRARGRGVLVRAERAGVPHRDGQWKRFWEFNSERGPDLGSAWLVLEPVRADDTITATTVNHWSWALFGALVRRRWRCSGFRAPSTPRLAQLAFLVVAGFLLVNKVYSPQYVLWLLPLAVLARPRWRDQLVWQVVRDRLLRVGVVVPRRRPRARRRARTSASTGSRS